MIDIGSVASANTNLVSGADASAVASDHSYRPYGNSGADVQSVSMSFGDLMDMINPLQHIPGISSLYRAATGESINPVSRIAGDALYGGALGLASAGLSALGAIGDEVVAANNDGKSASATIVAALFGDDKDTDTQVAIADSNPAAPAPTVLPRTGVLQTQAQQSPILDMPDFSESAAQAVASTAPSAATPAVADTPASKGLPLDHSKQPYGGVMDTAMVQNAQQNQTLALALAGSHTVLQSQQALRNNRFATATGTTPANPAIAAASQATPATEAAMQNLIKELQAMKAVNQYKNAAQSTPVSANSFNFVN